MQNAKDFTKLCRKDKLKVLDGLFDKKYTIHDIREGRIIISDGFYTNYLKNKNPDKFADKILIEGANSKSFYDLLIQVKSEDDDDSNNETVKI